MEEEEATGAQKKYGTRKLRIEDCDFVWAILTKDRFPAGEYNKLDARKSGQVEIVAKINPNAYRLKLPSHIRTADVFNFKHLFPYHGDSSNEEDLNLGTNSSQLGKDDAARIAHNFLF
ncbi:hypothetical protein L3X38_018953 [Prunus dulcis]|uniref:Tf2-1-like SH3-like domain-containing protein n=1 Tax=Prunus dulcis TaxID=3755 RepID=A0AAD4ZBI0_PRUDU|nr:hypothetical protein L3X38_018953 [Prunus dulcis]